MTSTRLILASASPRRRDLLFAAGVEFTIIASGVGEQRYEREPAAAYAMRVAADKARDVSARLLEALVLAADTVVELDGEVMLKPRDVDDARRMLAALAGRTHIVVTAYAIARGGLILESVPVTSRVTFRALSSTVIDAYIASGEPFDKAGGYGIQGHGASFITAVEGPRDNVMGLPVCEVLAALRRHGFDGF
jgi:septum formation protein